MCFYGWLCRYVMFCEFSLVAKKGARGAPGLTFSNSSPKRLIKSWRLSFKRLSALRKAVLKFKTETKREILKRFGKNPEYDFNANKRYYQQKYDKFAKESGN